MKGAKFTKKGKKPYLKSKWPRFRTGTYNRIIKSVKDYSIQVNSDNTTKKRVFSGIQPTGNLHLGNYLGAIRNWLDLQDRHDCLFGIMNLHAITVPQNPKELEANTLLAAATYLACGLDDKKSKIFIQSSISEHCELAWLLGCITPLGWLNRMTQFKDKKEGGEGELGLYSYPVLMAADILLYHADLVPVGEDQKQHLELTRDLAGAFNRRFAVNFFKLPEPLIVKETKRVMSLQDGTKKMSKSDLSEISRINLCDSPEEIVKKIKKAKTDSSPIIAYDETRAEIYNLLNIFAAITKQSPAEIAISYENSGFGKFKTDLADALIAHLSPISQKITEFLTDKAQLQKILAEGCLAAKEIASQTLAKTHQIIGI